MRPSFRRVRSCVSSTERPSESTLSFTSPTLVRTNFLDAHAVDPPTASTAIGIATNMFRNIALLLEFTRASVPRHVAVSGSNDQVLLPRADHERVPARFAARFERDEVLVPQLVDDLASRKTALRRCADDEHVAARGAGEVGQWSRERRA